jgi:hypothetical protein
MEEIGMKIVLDQRSCNCWDPACEAHFGWHFLREEITPVDCTVEVCQDGREELTFQIKDRDGSDKTLVVNQDNWAEAYDSWRLAWEKQAHQA